MTAPSIVADIGGTNARFAIAEIRDGAIVITDAQRFRAEDFETVRDAADAFLESVAVKPAQGCFAVAGPAGGDEIAFTNSPWRFRPSEIETALSLSSLSVVNDFHALAAGVRRLGDAAFETVKEGPGDDAAPCVVIGPGTGLGQALIAPSPAGDVIVPTEGGHVGFAPRTEEEIAVMQFIAREHPRVSLERLLSGRGLVNIHRALCVIADTPRVSLQANEITQAALEQSYPVATRAVDLFCEILGRAAGDAVLACGARGGVYLGGGILPKIREILRQSNFIDCFVDKGRMRPYLEATPVKLIVEERAALYGAAALISGDAP